MVNVGKYTIHGCYGNCYHALQNERAPQKRLTVDSKRITRCDSIGPELFLAKSAHGKGGHVRVFPY